MVALSGVDLEWQHGARSSGEQRQPLSGSQDVETSDDQRDRNGVGLTGCLPAA